jgi:isopentenyl diphosphate isomerase/L-lactate dehydrogenase-like FMN-dependent dehydrogenase
LGALVNDKVAWVGANEQKRAPCLVTEAAKLARKTVNPVVEKGKSQHDAHRSSQCQVAALFQYRHANFFGRIGIEG